jgi:hypothetical protein
MPTVSRRLSSLAWPFAPATPLLPCLIRCLMRPLLFLSFYSCRVYPSCVVYASRLSCIYVCLAYTPLVCLAYTAVCLCLRRNTDTPARTHARQARSSNGLPHHHHNNNDIDAPPLSSSSHIPSSPSYNPTPNRHRVAAAAEARAAAGGGMGRSGVGTGREGSGGGVAPPVEGRPNNALRARAGEGEGSRGGGGGGTRLLFRVRLNERGEEGGGGDEGGVGGRGEPSRGANGAGTSYCTGVGLCVEGRGVEGECV